MNHPALLRDRQILAWVGLRLRRMTRSSAAQRAVASAAARRIHQIWWGEHLVPRKKACRRCACSRPRQTCKEAIAAQRARLRSRAMLAEQRAREKARQLEQASAGSLRLEVPVLEQIARAEGRLRRHGEVQALLSERNRARCSDCPRHRGGPWAGRICRRD